MERVLDPVSLKVNLHYVSSSIKTCNKFFSIIFKISILEFILCNDFGKRSFLRIFLLTLKWFILVS